MVMSFGVPKSYFSHGNGKFKREDLAFIGDNVIIEDGVLIFHPQNIHIGNNVYIGHNAMLHGYHRNDIFIGDHTWVGQGCFFHGAGGIRIGNAVGIGPMVKILTSVHREEKLSKPIIFCDLEFDKVVIEDGCDIGLGSIILPGVEIGEGSIVGAGSVVTDDIPPYSVFAGNPAKLLRKRSD
ncbi:MAG: DapH/DapD/GlmU-related protein [Methanotrichaceae archaeon]